MNAHSASAAEKQFLINMPRQLQALKKHIDQRDAGSAGN